MMDKSQILILSPASDLHAKSVSARINELGSSTRFWSLDELLHGDTKLEYEVCTHIGPQLLVGKGENSFRTDNISAVWNRRPGQVRPPRLAEQWMERLVAHESNRAVTGILRSLDCLWVNHPAHQDNSLHKLLQLSSARKVGLSIPDTLVTDCPNAAKAFASKHSSNVIYKMVDEASFHYFPTTELPRGLPTMPLREKDFEHLDQVDKSLHLFQERVEKMCDVRTTVIGQKIFSARIESQEGRGKVDFRLDYSVSISKWKLPDDVAEGCIRLLRQLGLNFAAIDFAVRPDGTHIFLESNPAGQFLWLEDALQMPLSEELAKLLIGKAPPLCK